MKTIEQIIEQEPVFLNDFDNRFDVIMNFNDVYLDFEDYSATESPYGNENYWRKKKAEADEVLAIFEGVNILFASYGNDNYSGDAWVLFEKDGILYEVHGSHCSCYGLEGQWEPEEVDLRELEHRLFYGTFGTDKWSGNEFKQELMTFLGIEGVN